MKVTVLAKESCEMGVIVTWTVTCHSLLFLHSI